MKQAKTPTCFGIPMKWVSLLLLVAQTVSVVFCMRISRTQKTEGPRYLNTTAVFFSELLKLLCSCGFLLHENNMDLAHTGRIIRQHLFRSPKEFAKVCVPSLLYTVQNNLLFVSLSNLSGAVYQVTYQLKILTTAVLSVLILGKVLGQVKWLALLMLTAGVTLIQFPRGEGATEALPTEGNQTVGLMAVLCACITSGLAGVYLELILKQAEVSIWMRNIQLASIGAVVGLSLAFFNDGPQIREGGLLQGYTRVVWGTIWLQAAGGLVVAAVLKYADNILKCFGNAMSICISCLMSSVFLGEFTPDLLFALGTMLVLGATSMYSLGLPFLEPKKAKVEGPDCTTPADTKV